MYTCVYTEVLSHPLSHSKYRVLGVSVCVCVYFPRPSLSCFYYPHYPLQNIHTALFTLPLRDMINVVLIYDVIGCRRHRAQGAEPPQGRRDRDGRLRAGVFR